MSYIGKIMRIAGHPCLDTGLMIRYETEDDLYTAEPRPGATYVRVSKILLYAKGSPLEIREKTDAPPRGYGRAEHEVGPRR